MWFIRFRFAREGETRNICCDLFPIPQFHASPLVARSVAVARAIMKPARLTLTGIAKTLQYLSRNLHGDTSRDRHSHNYDCKWQHVPLAAGSRDLWLSACLPACATVKRRQTNDLIIISYPPPPTRHILNRRFRVNKIIMRHTGRMCNILPLGFRCKRAQNSTVRRFMHLSLFLCVCVCLSDFKFSEDSCWGCCRAGDGSVGAVLCSDYSSDKLCQAFHYFDGFLARPCAAVARIEFHIK